MEGPFFQLDVQILENFEGGSDTRDGVGLPGSFHQLRAFDLGSKELIGAFVEGFHHLGHQEVR